MTVAILKGFQLLRVVEEVVVKILNDLSKLLSVDHKADVYE
jgi:hypothetical protein